MNDIRAQDESDRFAACILSLLPKESQVIQFEDAEKPLAALLDVILENVDAVDTGDGQNGVALVFELALAVALFHNAQLAYENLRQKVARAASRFEKTRFDALGLLLDQIDHGVNFPLAGIDLAMIRHALFRDDVFVVHHCSSLSLFWSAPPDFTHSSISSFLNFQSRPILCPGRFLSLVHL